MRTALVLFSIASVALLATAYASHRRSATDWWMLSAPWSPFFANGSVNYNQIHKQAQYHAAQGVTNAWVNGGMAQWNELTIDERKKIAELWVKHGQAAGLYITIHVGDNNLSTARELAAHAQEIGADAIAIIPPFAPQKPSDMDTLVACLESVASRAPDLPMWYYHIPGTTGVNIKVSELLEASRNVIPTFYGVKYVDSNLVDYNKCVEMDGGKYNMLWAPEPKLQALPFGATGFVLAENYYCQYLRNVTDAYASGDMEEALRRQQVLDELNTIVGRGGKDVMRMVGIDLGPPRLPATEPLNEEEIRMELDAFGFFNVVGMYNGS